MLKRLGDARAEPPRRWREARFVGFGPRLMALLLDSLLMTVFGGLLALLLFGPTRTGVPMEHSHDALLSSLLQALVVVGLWTRLGATPGKLLMNCRVVDAASGQPPSLGQAVLRYLGYILSALPLGLGFLWVIWDRRRQGWHDKLARTLVVEDSPELGALGQLCRETA